jgi:hypothetical protein
MERLEAEMAAIRRAFPELVSQANTKPTAVADRQRQVNRRRGTLSAAGRAAIAAAQKARWARMKNGSTADDRRKRPAMSAAQRKAVSQRMKKYWAARRKSNA